MIKDYGSNEEIYGEKFLVTNVVRGVNSSGSPYLSITLQDKSGSIEAKKWEIEPGDYQVIDVGKVVRVDGVTYLYRDQMQLKVYKVMNVLPDDYHLEDYIPRPNYDFKALEKELDDSIALIKDKDYHLVVKTLLDEYRDKFISFPAATKNHHEFAGGLLVHSVHMVRLAKALLNLYPSLDSDILLSGTILHDLGKVIELSGPIIAKYTNEGRLIGHISIAHALISNKCKELGVDDEVRLVLEHLILTHHGKKEYGSPVEPMIKEALALNMIDDMDAKLEMVEKALHDVKGGEWSQRVLAFDDRSFYQPKKTNK